MIIKLISNQVPKFWDAIKFTITKTMEVSEGDLPLYFNELLHKLLSNKAQCFVKYNNERVLEGLMITEVKVNTTTGDKMLLISNIYSFKPITDEEWVSGFEMLKTLARQAGCKKITTHTKNPRLHEILMTILGFKLDYTFFSMEV